MPLVGSHAKATSHQNLEILLLRQENGRIKEEQICVENCLVQAPLLYLLKLLWGQNYSLLPNEVKSHLVIAFSSKSKVFSLQKVLSIGSECLLLLPYNLKTKISIFYFQLNPHYTQYRMMEKEWAGTIYNKNFSLEKDWNGEHTAVALPNNY